jgi:hypothetical protein
MGKFFLLSAALLLTACNSTPRPTVSATSAPQPEAKFEDIKLSSAQITKVKQAVIERLKDPESARFNSAFVASKQEGLIYVCSFVNAKNSYGGYTGNKPFQAILHKDQTVVFVVLGGDDEDDNYVLNACSKKSAYIG